MIKKPTKVHYNEERQTSFLFFDNRSDEWADPVECSMRGGICWPKTVRFEPNAEVEGFILLAGINVETRTITVFEQKSFVVVENIVRKDGVIEHQGIEQWLNTCWTRYFGNRFYWFQDRELTKKYRLEVLRSMSIQPKPAFIRIELSKDSAIPVHTIWKLLNMDKLKYERDSKLHEALILTEKGEKETLPAVHALTCLLEGVERHPWREP
jgi:hypothetical protein